MEKVKLKPHLKSGSPPDLCLLSFSLLHSGATARDSHPLPYSLRFEGGAPGHFVVKRAKGNPANPFVFAGADVIMPARPKSKAFEARVESI
jgi:hypothetical protein